jgi:hypothetical protein
LLELLGLVLGLCLLDLRLLRLLELLWLRCRGGDRSGRNSFLSGLCLDLRLCLGLRLYWSLRLCRSPGLCWSLGLLTWQDGCDGEDLLDNLIGCFAVARNVNVSRL